MVNGATRGGGLPVAAAVVLLVVVGAACGAEAFWSQEHAGQLAASLARAEIRAVERALSPEAPRDAESTADKGDLRGSRADLLLSGSDGPEVPSGFMLEQAVAIAETMRGDDSGSGAALSAPLDAAAGAGSEREREEVSRGRGGEEGVDVDTDTDTDTDDDRDVDSDVDAGDGEFGSTRGPRESEEGGAFGSAHATVRGLMALNRAIKGGVASVRRALAGLARAAAANIEQAEEAHREAARDAEAAAERYVSAKARDGSEARIDPGAERSGAALELARAVARKQARGRKVAIKKLLADAAEALDVPEGSSQARREKSKLPHLFVVGMGRNMNAVVGGQELVYDVDTLQVVPWNYVGLAGGTNFASVVGGSAYVGVGWKGKKRGSDNQDAYGGYFNIADAGMSTPIPGLGASGVVGVTGRPTEASKDTGTPDIRPVTDEVVTVSFSLGAGISALPFNRNVGFAKYEAAGNGECYSSVAEMASRVSADVSIGYATKLAIIAMLYAHAEDGSPVARRSDAHTLCSKDPVSPIWSNNLFRQVIVNKIGFEVSVPVPPHVCPGCKVVVRPEFEMGMGHNDDMWLELIGQLTVELTLDVEVASVGVFLRGRLKVESQTPGAGPVEAMLRTLNTVAFHTLRQYYDGYRAGLDSALQFTESYPGATARTISSVAASALGGVVGVAAKAALQAHAIRILKEYADDWRERFLAPVAEQKFVLRLGESSIAGAVPGESSWSKADWEVADVVSDPVEVPAEFWQKIGRDWFAWEREDEREARGGADAENPVDRLLQRICRASFGNLLSQGFAWIKGEDIVGECTEAIGWQLKEIHEKVREMLYAQVRAKSGTSFAQVSEMEEKMRTYADALDRLADLIPNRDRLAVRATEVARRGFEKGSEILKRIVDGCTHMIAEHGTTVEVDDMAVEIGALATFGGNDLRFGIGPGFRGTIHRRKPAVISAFPPAPVVDVTAELPGGFSLDLSAYARVYTNPEYVRKTFGVDHPLWWRLRCMLVLPTDLGVSNTASVMWLLNNPAAQKLLTSIFDKLKTFISDGFQPKTAGDVESGAVRKGKIKRAFKAIKKWIDAYMQQSPLLRLGDKSANRAAIEFDLSGYWDVVVSPSSALSGATSRVLSDVVLLTDQSDMQFLLVRDGVMNGVVGSSIAKKVGASGPIELSRAAAWWMSLDKILPANKLTLKRSVREVFNKPTLRYLDPTPNSRGYYHAKGHGLWFRYDGSRWEWSLDLRTWNPTSVTSVQSGRWKGQSPGGLGTQLLIEEFEKNNPKPPVTYTELDVNK